MRVYVVERSVDYEASDIVEVFVNESDAKRYIAIEKEKPENKIWDNWHIHPRKLRTAWHG